MSSYKTKASRNISGCDENGLPDSWKDIDISRDELDSITDAFKKDEFRQLFADYCKELTDPATRDKYQNEMKKLEAERGVEITFLNPTPHFVVKTSSNGKTKCFINIASNQEIEKPSNEVRFNEETDKKEMMWRLPYSQTEPRPDFDSKKNRCVVHDVLFHPDALHMAERNSMLRSHLINTACDAVEREYKVELDRTNLKFPKLKYKGVASAAVTRKLMNKKPEQTFEPSPLDEHMPPMPEVQSGQKEPKIYKSKEVKPIKYATPKYIIKHRRGIDMSEMTYELDAKLNLTIPKQLVIEIDLPLLKTTSDCTLDVTDRKLYLISEKPAKYQLNVELPYPVNDQLGSAKFDKNTKKLIVTLPVCSENERCLKDLYREDSGVESDPREENGSIDSPTRKESPTMQDPINESLVLTKGLPLIEVLNSEENDDEGFTKTEPSLDDDEFFLRSDISYNSIQNFDCNALDDNLVFVLHVKNVDPQSVEHRKSDNWVHLKFTSLGAGYYPIYYSFYFKLPAEATETHIKNIDAEAWDNNVILTLTLTKLDTLQEYLAGLNENDLTEYNTPGNFNSYKKLTTEADNCDENSFDPNQVDNNKLGIDVKHSIEKNEFELEIKPKSESNDSTEDEKLTEENMNNENKNIVNNSQNKNKNKKKKNKKRRSYSESVCDDVKANNVTLLSAPIIVYNSVKSTKETVKKTDKVENIENERNISIIGSRKQRSFSESRSISECTPTFKGILKHYSRYGRSISGSCSSFDDQYSISTDNLNPCESFSDIPEEVIDSDANGQSLSESCKKTVRFNEVIQKQLFRLDSSILGQRKKNQKKKNQKQRALQRRNSEGDTADYEDKDRTHTPPDKKGMNKFANSNNENSKSVQNKSKKRTESESSDIESKNSMMFDMEM